MLLPQAPAAFGLVSFLMHAGLDRNRIRKHLLVFALAAPVLAMLTFLGLGQVKGSGPGPRPLGAAPPDGSLKASSFSSLSEQQGGAVGDQRHWRRHALLCRHLPLRGHRARPS